MTALSVTMGAHRSFAKPRHPGQLVTHSTTHRAF